MNYPPYLLKIIDALRGLPGVGPKTAERYAFQLLEWPENRLAELGELIKEFPNEIKFCEECGALIDEDLCTFCLRQVTTLCIVGSPKDLYSIEETGSYRGLYHVLEGLLSPLEGRGPELLRLDRLRLRITTLSIQEVIIALDSTLEGDATALFLKQELGPLVPTSRLAFGLPLGAPLEHVDPGTLSQALTGRH